MKFARLSFTAALLALTLVFAACGGDATEQLVGAWKSEANDPATGKPAVLVFTKDSVTINGEETKATYQVLAVNVQVSEAAGGKVLFVCNKIEKETMQVSGERFAAGALHLKRISEDEAKQLTAQ